MKSIITVRQSSSGGHVITLMDVWGCVLKRGILKSNTAEARAAFKRKYIFDQKKNKKLLTSKPDMKQSPQREDSKTLFEEPKKDDGRLESDAVSPESTSSTGRR